MLTYKEIEAKYDVEEQYVSNAVVLYEVQPKGRKRNERGMLINTWDENEVIMAVVKLLNKKAENHIVRAKAWHAESARLLSKVGESA